MTDRKLTFGEKAVGLSFNPSGNEKVQKIKELFAEIIDLLNDFEVPDKTDKFGVDLGKFAIKTAISAQMWAVKFVTWGLK